MDLGATRFVGLPMVALGCWLLLDSVFVRFAHEGRGTLVPIDPPRLVVACGRAKALPETGLAWMNFFLLYVSLPALLFGIMSKTPFQELNNPPFLIATTLGTMSAFTLAMASGRLIGKLPLREATLAGLSGAYGNIGYMGPGLALAVLGAKAARATSNIASPRSPAFFATSPVVAR